jgi:hypothetical protein
MANQKQQTLQAASKLFRVRAAILGAAHSTVPLRECFTIGRGHTVAVSGTDPNQVHHCRKISGRTMLSQVKRVQIGDSY